MNAVLLVDLVLLAVFAVLAVMLLPGTLRTLRMYLTIKSRRLEDATSFAPPEPVAVARVADALMNLGFSRIGVRSTVLPGSNRKFEWDLADEPTTTYVAIVPAPRSPAGFLMASYSAFADGAFVETKFPAGSTVKRANLDAAPAGRSPEESVRAHYERVAAFSAQHGRPLANRTMKDLLARDDTYRRLHGGATIRRGVYLVTVLTALALVAAVAQLLRVIVLDR